MCSESSVKTLIQSNGQSIAYQVWIETIQVASSFLLSLYMSATNMKKS